MKINYDNMIVESSLFEEGSEAQTYFTNQKSMCKALLQDVYGDNHCVVKLVDSLSKEVKFCIRFSSEAPPNNLNLIVLYRSDRFIIELDNFLYFISLSKGDIVSKVELHTPLIGLHCSGEKLLILEEAGFKVVDTDGEIKQEETTDLIEDFTLKNTILNLITMEGDQQEIKLLLWKRNLQAR